MKILRLDLDAFGPFSGVSLDLAPGRYGLHLVHGPNEAGKTSALRALGNLLYGIPHRSPDIFRFDAKALRLGARLERSDGEVLEFVRFKKNKDALCASDGKTPLDPSRLERFLGGVDEALFRSMFGIGHKALVEGGREIVKGGGDLGATLFAASSGIAGLRGIQAGLKDDVDAFFLPQGKNQRIPRSIVELRAAQAKIKELTVTTEVWSKHDQALRAARERGAALEAQARQLHVEARRLGRVRDALPLLSERAQLVAELEGVRAAILLPEDFADRRRAAQQTLAHALTDLERAASAIEDLSARCEAIQVPGPLLAAGEEIEALHERRGEYRKAQADRPRNLAMLQSEEHFARDVLQSLGKPRNLAVADSLRLRADAPASIQQLALKAATLATRREQTREAIATHGRRIDQGRRALDALGTPPDLEPLRDALRAAGKLGDLEGRRDEGRQKLKPIERALGTALRQLRGWSGTTDALEALPVPLAETIARFEADFQAAEVRRRERESERTREEKAVTELEARLRVETAQRDLPTEDDLHRSRRRRDEGWGLVRRAWLDRLDDPDATQGFVTELAPGRSLADAFEAGVARSDDLADRLRREAEAVASRADRLAQREGHRARLARLAEEEAEDQAEAAHLAHGWEALTAPLGLAPLAPEELRAWLDRREKALGLAAQVRTGNAEIEQWEERIADQGARLASALTGLGELGPDAREGLAARIDRAQGVLARLDKVANQRERQEAELVKEEADLNAAEHRLAAIEAEEVAWRASWARSMARLGLDADATPEQAEVFLQEIGKLQEHLKNAKGFRARIEGIDRDGEKFAADVAAVVARVAPELAGQPPDAATVALHVRLRDAREADQALRSLREQIEARQEAMVAAVAARDDARRDLDALRRDAGCASVDDLPEAERRSERRARLEADLSRCEARIRPLSAGATVEAFLDEVGRLDPDALAPTIADLEREAAALQAQVNAIHQEIGAEQSALDAIDGGGRAAVEDEKASSALARLQADVPRYAALRIAAHVLQQAIERHRERTQGPVIRRASALFAALTAGSFESLLVEEDERGSFVLVGVRPGGQATLGVECMSDGSCDQLYLALRIASLENWLAVHEPIPLVVDDILLQFDDERAVAALRVLAALSTKTQVIFFTHHAHLLELARACLPADVLFTHELAAGRDRLEASAS